MLSIFLHWNSQRRKLFATSNCYCCCCCALYKTLWNCSFLFIVQFKKGVSFKMHHMYRRRMLSTRNKPFLWAKEKREKNQKHSNCATHMLMLRYVLQQQHSSKHSGRYNAGHPCHVRQVTTDSATRLVSSVAHTQKAPQLTTNKQHIHKHIYTIEWTDQKVNKQLKQHEKNTRQGGARRSGKTMWSNNSKFYAKLEMLGTLVGVF